MSDIFNTVKAYTTVFEHLMKTQIPSDIKEGKSKFYLDSLIPSWEPPTGNIKGPRNIYEGLDKAFIRVYKPAPIAELTSIPFEEVFEGQNIAKVQAIATGHPMVTLPAGENEFLPAYRPVHFGSKMADSAIISQILYQNLMNYPDNDTTFKKVVQAANEYSYGSGSYEGQIARLVAMNQIRYGRNGFAKPASLEKLNLDMEKMAILLEKTLPIPQAKNRGQDYAVALTSIPGDFIFLEENGEVSDFLPHFKSDTAAGLPYLKDPLKTKGSTLIENIAISNFFMKGLSIALKEKAGDKSNSVGDRVQKHLDQFRFMFTSLCVPKPERYKKSQWLTKTRNIMAAPFSTHILASMIVDPIMHHNKTSFVNFDTPSLQKFNPFGYTHELMTDAISPGSHVYIYADNVYISQEEQDGSHTWFSFDLIKGEANSAPDLVQAVMYYLLTRGWADDEGKPNFGPTWAFFAMNIYPYMASDATALLSNIQFQMPGLLSGVTVTFLVNHAKSSQAVGNWWDDGKPHVGRDGENFIESAKLMGINFQVERVTRDLEGQMAKLLVETPFDGWMQDPEATGPSSKVLPRIDLDLLGFDAVYSRALGRYVPVLAEERLFPSIAYPKKSAERSLRKEDPTAYRAYQIIQQEAIRLVGGWSINVVDSACKVMADNHREYLLSHDINIKEYLADWSSKSEYGEALTNDDTHIDLEHTMTGETLLNLHRVRHPGDPNPSGLIVDISQQHRELMDLVDIKGTLSRLPAIKKINKTRTSNLLKVTQQTALNEYLEKFKTGKMSERMLESATHKVYNRVFKEVSRIRDAMYVSFQPDAQKVEADMERASDPLARYKVPITMPKGAFTRLTKTTQHGDISSFVPTLNQQQSSSTRAARKNREKRRRDKENAELVKRMGGISSPGLTSDSQSDFNVE